jgi:hypothetical protein
MFELNFSCFTGRRKRSGRRRFRRTTRPAGKETQRGPMEDSKQRIRCTIWLFNIAMENHHF